MIVTDVKMAIASLKSAKLRSLLTMIGIIIGVTSVVLTVSLGEGIKRSFIGEAKRLGNDVITVRSGQPFEKDDQGRIRGLNIASVLGASTLSEKDVEAISALPNIVAVAPISLLAGSAQTDDNKDYSGAVAIASTPNLPDILDQKVKFGSFFTDDDANRNLAVIGSDVAEQLFHDEAPVGRRFSLRGKDFIVRGVMDRFKSANVDFAISYNSSVIIPIDTAKRINDGALEVREIQVKVSDPDLLADTTVQVKSTLLQRRGGEEDFTILNQQEFLNLTTQVFNLLTGFVTAIAAISLFVGGVGIMNIMLVSVTERTREIGVRKAIGATNRQILGQFLIEAVVLSVSGGILGVLGAVIVGAILTVSTNLTPAFEPVIVAVAMAVSVAIGIIFGITPALKAARKDPIEALRHD